ncbi:uroporphyrinogen decarboxylase family protein [Candidatus Contubernalis alkaliaceticus]|uniref:uroporphyrinogen decarboxylase family protein n=1 Tax=Candidatus Contubernalis alkaliaceticus TaxID=338645 RepID=UPI001F4BDD6B|nr:uroporphyrinogen decarboxylase family protein [Candidatus Contubernalis alkalaceticus]UNC91576.1 methyltransferase [Candidatus Contubernalis alkalaceticus]
MTLTSKERVIKLIKGEEVDRPACFSGMGNVTTEGLNQLNYSFPAVHGDAKMMATLAASTYKLFGYECAVVPFDFCLEAEVLGCMMNPYENVDQLLYPTIKEKVLHEEEELWNYQPPTDIEEIKKLGRIPVVIEAMQLLKADIGDKVPIGTYYLGPFTLLGQIFDLDKIFKLAFKKQDKMAVVLDKLADFLIIMAKIFKEAGADYITVREMGATTDILSPKLFNSLIMPPLKKIFAALNEMNFPNNLHICGSTNSVIKFMNEAGADTISVEFKNDMNKTREDIGTEPIIFGNLDAYKLLCHDSVEDVENAVVSALEVGCDGIWPGCDIWPEAKPENVKAMVDAVAKHGAEKWNRKK